MSVLPVGRRPILLIACALAAVGLVALVALPWGGAPSLLHRGVALLSAGDRGQGGNAGPDRTPPEAPGAGQDAGTAKVADGNEDADKDGAGADAGPDGGGVASFDPESLRLANLKIEPASYQDLAAQLAVTGTVEADPDRMAQVTARIGGKIRSVQANVGDAVSAGQPLATLTSVDLAQAQAAYRQAASRVAVAEIDLQRERQLAGLGEFAQPPIETARTQAATAEGDAKTTQSEAVAAQAGVLEAESGVQALQAALEQAQTQVGVVRSRFDRANLLLKAQLISRQQWEQAQADLQRAQADVSAARANLAEGQARVQTAQAGVAAAQATAAAARQRARIAAQALAREQAVYRGGYATSKEIVAAEAGLRQAQLDRSAAADNIRLLGETPGGGDLLAIRSPLSGDVTQRLVTLGETVTADKTLFTIVNLQSVWVQLNVYPNDLPDARVGHAVTITADTAPGRVFHGRVSYVSDLVDPATRTVKVRCAVLNPGDRLKPGGFVRGAIAGSAFTRTPAVPKDAVQRMGGRSVVFVPGNKPGEFAARPVSVGVESEGLVPVRSGLKAGERIVVGNAFLVKAQALKASLGEEGDSD